MPIPTDTFWNMRRLNKVFAISAVLLLAVTGWAIFQDYERQWRQMQRDGFAWEAALVDQRVQREVDEQTLERLENLQQRIAAMEVEIEQEDQQYVQFAQRMRQLETERSREEFRLNTLMSEVQVMEANLQDAITAGDTRRIQQIRSDLAEPQRIAADRHERIGQMQIEIEGLQEQMAAKTEELDALRRDHTLIQMDIDALEGRLAALRPRGLARLSAALRSAPLLQFINPAERVHTIWVEDVLTDLGGFVRMDTADRCMTCHVNIHRREFSEENLLAFLEEQTSITRGLILPQQPGARAVDPQATVDRPGPTAMVEFWHNWTRTTVPDAFRRNAFRIRTLAGMVGTEERHHVRVWHDGEPLESFAFDLDATDPDLIRQQDAVLVALIKAWYRFEPAADSQTAPAVAVDLTHGRVRVQILSTIPDRTATTARNNALKYPEILQEALHDQLPADLLRQLRDRYRFAMVKEVNPHRKRQGLEELSASPVLLAHPNLDLFVDADSPHPYDTIGQYVGVGCTSCHDGSGQETNFVLAAHTARPIWVDERTGEPVLPQQLDLTDQPLVQRVSTMDDMLETAWSADAAAEAAARQAGLHLHLEPEQIPHVEALYPAPDDASPMAYVDPATGATGRAVPQIRHWIRKYEPESGTSFKEMAHYWDLPMRPAKYIEANCMRCHSNVYDIAEHAPVLHKGRSLFAQMGCLSCHAIDHIPEQEVRMVGTDLRKITGKLSPEMIHTWIWAPKAFRPTTKMPHLFMLENSSSDEELRRTRQEVRAITEYLMLTASEYRPQNPLPEEAIGDVQRGRQVFNAVGCVGCHTNLNEVGEQWISTDLEKRAGLNAEEARQRFAAMDYNERQMYAHLHFPEAAPGRPAPVYADGEPRPVFIEHGPELSAIGTKLTAGRDERQAQQWLFDWLKNPNHYAPDTVMPSLRLSDQEAMDLVAYLLEQRRTATSPDDTWQAGLAEADPEKLRELTAHFLRARFSANMAYEKAAEPQELLSLAADALVTPERPRDQAEQLARSLSPEQQQMAFLGKRLISHYGCMSCHAINGAEDLASPCANLSDWGEKRIDMLDFAYLDGHKNLPRTTTVPMVNATSVEAANLAHTLPQEGWQEPVSRPVDLAWPHVHHNREDWLTHKLKNPRVYDRGRALLEPGTERDEHGRLINPGRPYDKLKMPAFYLTDEQVDALVTFVISNREPLITERMLVEVNSERQRQVALGRELANRYNCIGCHQVENNTPPVQQYFPREQWTTHAPPSLRGQGSKTRHDWLFDFLREVEPIRPVPQIRMPSFDLTDEEASALVAYFSAAARSESIRLRRTIEPVFRYVAEQREDADEPLGPPESVWPGDDWHTRPAFASAARRLREWAIAFTPMTAVEFDPFLYTPEELGHNYRRALYHAEFLANLFDGPYPFVESSRPVISQQRFALGEQFMHQMECLQCHVMGDPAAPGAHPEPTAPNLSLVHERLQRRFVRSWIQGPSTIQPGTAMPPFFSGLSRFQIDGLPYHEAQPNIPSEIGDRFGHTVEEQTELLLDFLYAAGRRGHTSVQPGGVELEDQTADDE